MHILTGKFTPCTRKYPVDNVILKRSEDLSTRAAYRLQSHARPQILQWSQGHIVPAPMDKRQSGNLKSRHSGQLRQFVLERRARTCPVVHAYPSSRTRSNHLSGRQRAYRSRAVLLLVRQGPSVVPYPSLHIQCSRTHHQTRLSLIPLFAREVQAMGMSYKKRASLCRLSRVPGFPHIPVAICRESVVHPLSRRLSGNDLLYLRNNRFQGDHRFYKEALGAECFALFYFLLVIEIREHDDRNVFC